MGKERHKFPLQYHQVLDKEITCRESEKLMDFACQRCLTESERISTGLIGAILSEIG